MAKTQLVVIGAGPGGITAALEAARFGGRVTLLSDGPVGGRAGWSSLLPSKVLLHAARRHDGRGRMPDEQFAQMVAGIDATAERFVGRKAGLLGKAGVKVLSGKARIEGPRELSQSSEGKTRRLAFDKAILATGSVPVFPPSLRPDGDRIIAPRLAKKMTRLPPTMCVVGGGVTGTEFAYAFASLGVEVTWVVDQFGVLPSIDRRPVRALLDKLSALGVTLVEGTPARSLEPDGDGVTATLRDGRALRAAQAFVAIGRRPDVADLGLDAAGLELCESGPARGGVAVDEYARSAVPHIFAAGDITGAPMVANKAQAQAWTAGRAALDQSVPPTNADTWVRAVFTHPQIAQVGISPEQSRRLHRPTRRLQVDYLAALDAHLGGDPTAAEGFVELTIDIETDAVIGASACGPHAAEVLTPISVAVRSGTTTDVLAATFPAHPTFTELAFRTAR